MSVKKRIILFSTAFILIIAISFVVMVIRNSDDEPVTIFENISEVEQLNFKRNDNLRDKYIENIPYEKAYIGTVKYENIKFKIFAYEFSSIQDAKSYYRACSTKDLELDDDFCYEFSAGMSSAKGMVFNGKNLYRIEAGTNHLDKIQRHLASAFTLTYVGSGGFVEQTEDSSVS